MTKSCSKCLKSRNEDSFYKRKRKSGKYGLDSICKACRYKMHKAWCRTNPEKHAATQKANNIKNADKIAANTKAIYPKLKADGSIGYASIKSRSKTKGWVFKISKKDYKTITSYPCHYCKDPLNGLIGGLDRVDSSIGYDVLNVVPCCFKCNSGKGSMAADDFISHCKKVYENSLKQNF